MKESFGQKMVEAYPLISSVGDFLIYLTFFMLAVAAFLGSLFLCLFLLRYIWGISSELIDEIKWHFKKEN